MRKLIAVMMLMLLSCARAECISPTTGLSIMAEPTAPVIVSVSNGRELPWGVEQADIVYESILYGKGQTRFAFLFHDALVNGAAVETGPVRSPREVHAMLMKEWHAGLIANGSKRANIAIAPGLADDGGWFLNTYDGRGRDCSGRIRSRKAPDNMSVDAAAAHRALPDQAFRAEGFRFVQMDAPQEPVMQIHIDWGNAVSDFFYIDGGYRREGWEGAFANVIVQLMEYEYLEGSLVRPLVPAQGGGEVVLFMNGHVRMGRWQKESASSKTFFLDEEGREISICTGRTFIAHLPVKSGVLQYQ